jgi:hypothetical protein
MSLSVINFKSETFETNLFIKCTSIEKIRKEKIIQFLFLIFYIYFPFRFLIHFNIMPDKIKICKNMQNKISHI